jgi:NAD(P)-dependent dehydrogenase (short-subunit alcohol dehydrogenase family)
MSSLSTLTYPEWDRKTRGLEVATAFSEHIRGKNGQSYSLSRRSSSPHNADGVLVLITGVSPESIGSSTARSIASQSPRLLILASRTQSKLEQVVKSIRDNYPSTNVYTVLLDLMSQDSIKSAADQVTKMTDSLNVIVNNAGIMTSKLQYTNEGIEAQFGANHIGHFLFTNLLLPLLETASRSNSAGTTRVVNLTSLGHRLSPIRFHDYNFEGNPIPDGEKYQGRKIPDMCRAKEGEVYNGYIAYGQAKTANILFSVGLNKRFEKDGILSYAVHPGCKSLHDID